jgi:hypothetical protein
VLAKDKWSLALSSKRVYKALSHLKLSQLLCDRIKKHGSYKSTRYFYGCFFRTDWLERNINVKSHDYFLCPGRSNEDFMHLFFTCPFRHDFWEKLHMAWDTE